MEQRLRVASGGWLELRPELFIPQAACAYRQSTVIEVEPGGELFFAETLAPGRVARGERFAFAEVAWALDLRRGSETLVRERYTLRRDDASTWSLRHPFDGGYYAGCYLVSDRAGPAAALQGAIHGLADAERIAGMTRLAPGCWSIKLLASGSEALRQTLAEVRRLLAPDFPGLAADARKL
jgi:urease accessory protein